MSLQVTSIQEIQNRIVALIHAETGANEIEVTISSSTARGGDFISVCGPVAEVEKARAFMVQGRELIATETEDPADECFDETFAAFAFDFYRL